MCRQNEDEESVRDSLVVVLDKVQHVDARSLN